MAKHISYDRIVVYQPRNGWVMDLGPGRCLTPRYGPDEEYFRTGAGTRSAIARSRELVIPIFDEESIRVLRIMHKEGCEVRCIAIGKNHNIVWELDSEINIVETNQGIGGTSGINLVLHNDMYHGSIYQSEDLAGGIPWECESATDDGSGTYYFNGPSGWQGNKWLVTSIDSVDGAGAASIFDNIYVDMYMPIENATVKLTGSFVGSLTYKDFSGATISSLTKSLSGTDASGTVPAKTWTARLSASSASTRPKILVTDAGALSAARPGGCIDCSDLTATLSTAPSWSS